MITMMVSSLLHFIDNSIPTNTPLSLHLPPTTAQSNLLHPLMVVLATTITVNFRMSMSRMTFPRQILAMNPPLLILVMDPPLLILVMDPPLLLLVMNPSLLLLAELLLQAAVVVLMSCPCHLLWTLSNLLYLLLIPLLSLVPVEIRSVLLARKSAVTSLGITHLIAIFTGRVPMKVYRVLLLTTPFPPHHIQ